MVSLDVKHHVYLLPSGSVIREDVLVKRKVPPTPSLLLRRLVLPSRSSLEPFLGLRCYTAALSHYTEAIAITEGEPDEEQ